MAPSPLAILTNYPLLAILSLAMPRHSRYLQWLHPPTVATMARRVTTSLSHISTASPPIRPSKVNRRRLRRIHRPTSIPLCQAHHSTHFPVRRPARKHSPRQVLRNRMLESWTQSLPLSVVEDSRTSAPGVPGCVHSPPIIWTVVSVIAIVDTYSLCTLCTKD